MGVDVEPAGLDEGEQVHLDRPRAREPGQLDRADQPDDERGDDGRDAEEVTPAIGSAAADVPSALKIGVPQTVEELAPILEILPVQRIALGLAVARGGNPDRPTGLLKVTKTR